MGTTKTEIFTQRQNLIAKYAKALGHPARVAILQHLIGKKGCVCGDIVSEIGLAQATVSQHLKELKNIGILQGNVEGTSVCYCIDPSTWQELNSALGAFLGQEVRHADNCC